MAGSLAELHVLAEAPRMNVPHRQLIAEAIAINHADAGKKTLAKHAKHLDHWAGYLESHGLTFVTLQRRHVRLFMAHLAEHGGPKPHDLRLRCQWCAHRGWPDGDHGPGWSASTRKSYLSAARFTYTHFANERDLPDIDPTTHVKSPRLVIKRQFTPTPEQVRAIFDAPGEPKDRLLAVWSYYALHAGRRSQTLAGGTSTLNGAPGTSWARATARTASTSTWRSSGSSGSTWRGSSTRPGATRACVTRSRTPTPPGSS